jgi:flagellar biosynthesis/type III secretory pathway protein FliH
VSVHDPGLHDPRLAALLAGVPRDHVAAAPGLARLLSSLMAPQPPAPSAPEAPPSADMDALLAAARAQAEAQGFAAGEAAGRAAERAELAPLRAALVEAAAAARAVTCLDEARLAPLLTGLVKAVAEAVLMAELAAGGRVLAPLVAAALAEVAEAALPCLQAHPDTLALIADDLPPGLGVAADPALPPGHIVVAGPDYRVEAGLGERLARLVEAL